MSQRSTNGNEDIDLSCYDCLGDLSTLIQWPELKPKHTFLLCYGHIIREGGSLAHSSTLRPESKNGKLKVVDEINFVFLYT